MASTPKEEILDRRARVRENQRRSRARKQEYTQELVQKLARHEAAATQNDIQQRISIQRLQAENEKLRQLLYSLGAQPATVNAYLLENDDPSVGQKVAIPRMGLQSPESCCTNGPEKNCQSNPAQHGSVEGSQNTCQAPKEDDSRITIEQPASSERIPNENNRSSPSDHQPPIIGSSSPVSAAEPAAEHEAFSREPAKREESRPPRPSPGVVPDCDCQDEDPESWPQGESRFGTTLCAVAGELIMQYNTLGIDPADIKRRLRAGFQKEMALGEGCRVQNQLLFEVLNEISGNLS